MGAGKMRKKKANYGIDAPGVLRNLLMLGFGGCLVVVIGVQVPDTAIASIVISMGITFAALGFVESLLMVVSSKAGKLRQRDHLLDALNLRGDERVLDLGCGSGLLLIGAAKRLTTGKAIGVDIWQKEDQSGNSPDVTRANAEAEGVADRIEILDNDMRHMTLPKNSFDVVVSCLAIHNVYDEEDRTRVLLEILRVLKPGGRVALLDFRHTAQYAAIFWNSGGRIHNGPS